MFFRQKKAGKYTYLQVVENQLVWIIRGCKPLLVRPGRRVVREVKVLSGAYALRPLNRR